MVRRAKFRAGEVVSIRVNPKDCMSCVDVVKKIGLPIQGGSFAIVVSSALASLLETFRQNNIIPTRDGFEFNEIMSAFPKTARASRARALAITETFHTVGSSIHIPPIIRNPDFERKKIQFDALAFRNENDPINVTDAEREEMLELARELNPL